MRSVLLLGTLVSQGAVRAQEEDATDDATTAPTTTTTLPPTTTTTTTEAPTTTTTKKTKKKEDATTTATTTTTEWLPQTYADITPEFREKTITELDSLKSVIVMRDGERMKSACLFCQAKELKEYIASREEAKAAGHQYWGYNVNREFPEVDAGGWSCVQQIARRWLVYPEPEFKDLNAQFAKECSDTMDVLIERQKKHGDVDIDHIAEGKINAMSEAVAHDSFGMAAKLVELGEKESDLRFGGHQCIHHCMRSLAVGDDIKYIRQFQTEKWSESNFEFYHHAILARDDMYREWKWCDFFAKNKLKCADSEEQLQNLEATRGDPALIPPQRKWAAARIRNMFGAPAKDGDKELLEAVTAGLEGAKGGKNVTLSDGTVFMPFFIGEMHHKFPDEDINEAKRDKLIIKMREEREEKARLEAEEAAIAKAKAEGKEVPKSKTKPAAATNTTQEI